MPKISFLGASQPLTKSFSLVNRELRKTAYPLIKNFTSYTHDYKTLKALHKLIESHASQNHCMLKGNLQWQLKNEPRAGSTNSQLPTQLLCLDLDGIKGIADVESFLFAIGLNDISYIVQYSASMGVDPNKGLSAHIFMMLDEPILPDMLKLWLMKLNFDTVQLSEQLVLTASGVALRWPLDISVAQNDKLIYIAPPILGPGLKDPYVNNRISLVNKPRKTLTIDLADIVPGSLHEQKTAMVNTLRKVAGLPVRRSLVVKELGGIEVITSVEHAVVTGVKEDRDWVYLNLNGGDSWGYYHTTSNPEIVYNFKGEPNYSTKHLIPDYYKEAKHKYAKRIKEASAAEAKKHAELEANLQREIDEQHIQKLSTQKTGRAYLGFNEKTSDRYFYGYYDFNTDSTEIYRTSSMVKVTDYLQEHGQVVPDFLPSWTFEFDFSSDVIFDPTNKRINMFQRTDYMRNPKPSKVVPSTISRVIMSALGDSKPAYDHFINWLAYIIQKRDPARTAWILHGTQGTGKGVLFNHILAPIVGHDYVQTKLLGEMEENFNGFMQHCVFLLIDEVQMTDLSKKSKFIAKLKSQIVEPKISIRPMYAGHFMARNWTNFIFASNKPDPVEVDQADRRLNVADYQNTPIKLSVKDIKTIESELYAFTGYLMQHKVDADAARTPMESQSKEALKSITEDSLEEIARALKQGNLDYFIGYLPTRSERDLMDAVLSVSTGAYTQVMTRCLAALDSGDGKINLSRDDLHVIFTYLHGDSIPEKGKFTKLLRHKGITIKPVWINEEVTRGIQAEWVANDETLREARTKLSTERRPLKAVK